MTRKYGGDLDDPELALKRKKTFVAEILTPEKYMEQYRGALIEALDTQYNGKMSYELIKERVMILFPDENFYFYKEILN